MLRVCILGLITLLLASASVSADQFYLLDNLTDELLVGDLADPAAAAPVGSLGSTFWGDLAAAPQAAHVFATDVNSRLIVTLDGAN